MVSILLESSFTPGISNHMRAVLYLPRCEKCEQSSSKAALTSLQNPCESPEVACALIDVNISEALVS